MSVRSSLVYLLLGCAILFANSPAMAQRKFANFASFKRVDANPTKNYALTEASGPWLIMAASFAGPGAENEARQLVLELRKRYKLTAYTHAAKFDFTEAVVGKGIDRYGNPKRMKHNTAKEYNEIAVLVGDFPNINDPQLQQTLKQLKYLRPTALSAEGVPTTQRFANLRTVQRYLDTRINQKRQTKGPLGSAFVARNPMLPQEYFTPTGFDSFVQNMNKGVKHSLLKCPKAYSVRVATFRGNAIIDQGEIAKIQKNGGMKSQLTLAAENAHRLTDLLRKRGVEAYEFHDRHESIVTVGSFDQVGTPRDDGKIEIDQRVYKVITNYGPSKKKLPNGTETGMLPKSLEGISFDLQPVPVAVPRRSIAADYAGSRR